MVSASTAALVETSQKGGRRLWADWLWAAIVILLSLLLLSAWAMRPSLRADILPSQIRPFANLPYTAPVLAPSFPYTLSSDALASTSSQLLLYENGNRLGPAHAQHDRIREVGRGAYSHWGRTVIFSSSDGTDPRTNGRRYSLEVTAELSPVVLWPGLLLILAAGAIGLRRWWRPWLDLLPESGTTRRSVPLEASAAHRLHVSSSVIGLCLVITAVLAVVSYFGVSERSAWILMTAPDFTHRDNSLLGFSSIQYDRPIHIENTPFLAHLLMFSGGPIADDIYALRPLYTYLASALVPLLSWIPALLAMNLIAWAVGVAFVYAFAFKVTSQRAVAFWASLLAVGGMGFVAHVHDYSAHLLAFTFYFAAVYLVYVSDLWRASQPWRVHIGIGCFLALASLEYHTGLAALLGYALASVRHNRLMRIAVICAFVYGCTALWPHALNWLGGTEIDYGAVERRFLKTAIDLWIQLSADPLLLLRSYGGVVLRFLSYEMPLLLAFGAAGLAALVVERRNLDFAIFVAAFSAVPILALAVYTGPALVSRGYISYQTSIFIYVGAGWLLHRLAWLGPRGPALASLAGMGLLAASSAWNLAYLVGVVGPLKIYFLGIEPYWTGLTGTLSQMAHIPEVVSLTGAEPAPRLFFGSATLLDAGLVPCTAAVMRVMAPEHYWLRALVVRAPFLLLTVGAALSLLRAGLLHVGGEPLGATVRAYWLTGGLAVLVGASALINYPTRAQGFPSFCNHNLGAAAGRHLRYEVDVSPQFLARLDALPADVKDLEILHGFRQAPSVDPSVQVALVGDGLRVEFSRTDPVPRVNRVAVIAALHRTPRLALEVTHASAAPITAAAGWQRNGLPGRRLIVDGRNLEFAEQPVLPVLEIRARQPGGMFLPDLVGF